jgi:hypothetical protein
VAPFITGIILYFRFHIPLSLYINSYILAYFPLPFARHVCLWVLSHLSVCMSSFFVFNFYILPVTFLSVHSA